MLVKELQVNIKIADEKYLRINKVVYLNNKPMRVVGLWNTSIVLVPDNQRTVDDFQVRIFTSEELKDFYKEGSLQGLIEIKEYKQ